MDSLRDKKRLKSLESYQVMGTPDEKEFDDIAFFASHVCDTPTALVTFLSDTTQYIKSGIGFDQKETRVEESFCQYCLENLDDLTIITDAKHDVRLTDNPFVHTDGGFAFYAGAPLINEDGMFLGSLCVLDIQPRVLSNKQKGILKMLADQVMQVLELRKSKLILKEKLTQLEIEHKKIQNILNSTSIGTWEWDLSTGKLDLNANWKEMLGLNEKDQIDLRELYESLIHPDDLAKAKAKMNAYLNGDCENYQAQYRLKHKSGIWVWIIDQGQVMKRKPNGDPHLMFGTHTNITQMVNANEELIKKERKFKLLVENSLDAFAILSEDGMMTYFSPACLNLLSCKESEIQGTSFFEFVHPEDKELFKIQIESSKKQPGKPSNPFVIKVFNCKNELSWLSITLTNWFSEPLIKGILINFKEITKEIKLEKLLENASQMARVGAWEVNLETGENIWSKITREIHEVTEDFIPNLESSISFYRKDYEEFVRSEVQKIIDSGNPFDFEAPLITAKGNEVWVRAIGNGEFVDGKCIRIFGSFQDIHDRKIIETQLKGLSDNLPGVIFQYTLHPDGTDSLDHVSKGSENLWGMSPEECKADIQKIWNQIKLAGDYDVLLDSIVESASNMSPWTCEWRNRTLDGKIRWHQGFGKPQLKPDGRIVWDSLIMDITEKKHLENLLTQTAKMSKIGSWEIDLQQKPYFLSWSDTTQEILESELHGVDLEMAFMAYSEEFKERAHIVMKDLLENGKSFDEEALLITPKGNPKWVRVLGQAVLFHGEVTYAFGSFQDIHEQKIAQLQLKELLEEKTQLLDSIGDGFFTIDRNNEFTYFNRVAEKYFHKKQEEVIGKNIWEIIDQNEVPLTFQNFQEAWTSKKNQHFEEYYPQQSKWFSISVYPSRKGLTVYFKDESQAILAEEEIKKSNERFQVVSEATNDAIWDYDIEKDILFWGKGFETLFLHDLKHVNPNMNLLLSLIHEDDRERIKERIKTTFEDPSINQWNEEYRFLKGDGTYAYVIDRAKFIKDSNGHPKRAIGAMSDITARYEYQKSLEKINEELDQKAQSLASINKELEQFAYVVSHDLQEPLRMITSFLALLEKRNLSVLDEKSKNYISFANDGAVRMRKLILDLLEFSRVGSSSDKPEKFQFSELIKDSLLLQQSLIREKKAEIIVKGDIEITNLKTPLTQLITNLVSNGLKYAKIDEKPVIEITCKDHGKNWSFSIKDNGVGIEEEYFEKIFLIFQRLRNRSSNEEGTGLGLAIVKKIVDRLHGKIEVQSQVGVGSTFTITLPK